MEERQQRDNSGMIFCNSNKKPGDNQPSMYGFVTIGGVDYRVSAWTRFSQRDGSKCLSMQFQKKDEWEREREAYKAGNRSAGTVSPQQHAAKDAVKDDDNLPF